ncbi:hypothetical protein [Mesorhizobium sp. LNHC209A00]|uniref:hypothetical protein n=1 Tax=Mesorhizobium TaxID=68287 RepID=UPI00068406E4
MQARFKTSSLAGSLPPRTDGLADYSLIGRSCGYRRFANEFSANAYTAAEPGAACKVNGNISIQGGERIYHVPGQKNYSQTIIRPEFGERWFRGASTTGGLAKIEAMSRANSDEAYVLVICDEVFGAISEK